MVAVPVELVERLKNDGMLVAVSVGGVNPGRTALSV